MKCAISIKTLSLSIAFCVVAACAEFDVCGNLKSIPDDGLQEYFQQLDKNELSHSLYLMGECSDIRYIRILAEYLNDHRISHHAQHKGMKLNYISAISLVKVLKIEMDLRKNTVTDEQVETLKSLVRRIESQM